MDPVTNHVAAQQRQHRQQADEQLLVEDPVNGGKKSESFSQRESEEPSSIKAGFAPHHELSQSHHMEDDATCCTYFESNDSLSQASAGNYFLHLKKMELLVGDAGSKSCAGTIDQKRKPRRVAFYQVELRFYDQTLGDHPSTSYGPPISLDWNYQETEPLHVNIYELNRGKRRTKQQLIVDYDSRKNTLMWCYGHTELEIQNATKVCRRIALQRRITEILLPLSKLEDFVTSVYKKLKRARKLVKRRSFQVLEDITCVVTQPDSIDSLSNRETIFDISSSI